MSHWKVRVAAVAAVTLVLGSTATAAFASSSAQHGPSTPAHAAPLLRSLVGPQSLTTPRAQDDPPAVNPLFDADVVIAIGSAGPVASGAGEGRLVLKHTKGTSYAGSFYDNFSAKSFKASGKSVSATTEDGIYTIALAKGTIIFTVSGSTTTLNKWPKVYGKHRPVIQLQVSAHKFTVSPSMTFTTGAQQIPGLYTPTTGTLVVTTDAEGVIVPENDKRHVTSRYSFTTPDGKHHTAKVTSWGTFSLESGVPSALAMKLKLNGVNWGFTKTADLTGTGIQGVGINPAAASLSIIAFTLEIPAAPAG